MQTSFGDPGSLSSRAMEPASLSTLADAIYRGTEAVNRAKSLLNVLPGPEPAHASAHTDGTAQGHDKSKGPSNKEPRLKSKLKTETPSEQFPGSKIGAGTDHAPYWALANVSFYLLPLALTSTCDLKETTPICVVLTGVFSGCHSRRCKKPLWLVCQA